MLGLFFIICILAGLAVTIGLVASAALRFLEGMDSVNEAAQAEYALRLRREAGWKDFEKQFGPISISRADLKCAYDLLWLDVLWQQPMELTSDSRLDEMYEEGRRLEDVVSTLVQRCRLDQELTECERSTPETAGELVAYVSDLRRRSRDFDFRRLLRASSSNTELLRVAAIDVPHSERLMRASQPEDGQEKSE